MVLTGKTIVLYDGVCALCNRLCRFLLRFDRHDRLRFAALQSTFAVTALPKHDLKASDLNTVTLISDYGLPGERAYVKSDAVVFAARELGGLWQVGQLVRFIPRRVRDGVYDLIARTRYRTFGKFETCPVPPPKYKDKFIG